MVKRLCCGCFDLMQDRANQHSPIHKLPVLSAFWRVVDFFQLGDNLFPCGRIIKFHCNHLAIDNTTDSLDTTQVFQFILDGADTAIAADIRNFERFLFHRYHPPKFLWLLSAIPRWVSIVYTPTGILSSDECNDYVVCNAARCSRHLYDSTKKITIPTAASKLDAY